MRRQSGHVTMDARAGASSFIGREVLATQQKDENGSQSVSGTASAPPLEISTNH